jgi:hypothetical protein
MLEKPFTNPKLFALQAQAAVEAAKWKAALDRIGLTEEKVIEKVKTDCLNRGIDFEWLSGEEQNAELEKILGPYPG